MNNGACSSISLVLIFTGTDEREKSAYEEVVDKLSWNSAAISHLQINTSDIEFQLTGYPIISGLFSVCRFSA